MAPPVTNSEDPDGTESEKESENLKVPAPLEPTLNIDNKLESAAPSTDMFLNHQLNRYQSSLPILVLKNPLLTQSQML